MSLRAVNVTKSFPGRGRHASEVVAVRDVTLELSPGETLGLVGESGSGKSTLGRLVLGLLAPTTGRIEFDGAPLVTDSRAQLTAFRREVQAVFQDPRSALNSRMSIEKIVTEPLRNYRVGDRGSRRRRALELLDQVRLPAGLLTRHPADVSGGQLQRVAIARALALDPGYLVCDEPLSALDVSVQAGVVNLLLELQRSRGLAILFISHDLEVVRHVSDRVMVMYRGDVVEQAAADDFYGRPQHWYSRVLLGLEEPAPDVEPGEPEPVHSESAQRISPRDEITMESSN